MAREPRDGWRIGPPQREQPVGRYHDPQRAREVLHLGLERHGCATTRQLADKLGVPHGPGLLTAIGYRGHALAAWREMVPELAGEPDQQGG
jgi:hypothetical protein